MPDDPLPLDYRREVLEGVVKTLCAGESCSIVGVGSSGKSNLARHLSRADVRLHYFGLDAPHTVVLYINAKPFAQQPLSNLYLHILERLINALTELDGTFTATIPTLTDWLHHAEKEPPLLAKRYLDRALALVFQHNAQRVLLILDDCDDLIRHAPPHLFCELRAIRDDHKRRLVYLTLTRRELVFLRHDTPEYNEFFELFDAAGHIFPLPMYSETESAQMLRRLAARQQPPRELTPSQLRLMYEWTGGHAGLLRRVFFATLHTWDITASDWIERLSEQADIEAECCTIWTDLEMEEQEDLLRLVACETPSPEGVRRLIRLDIVRRGTEGDKCFSPLFAAFVRRELAKRAASKPIEFDASGGVRADGVRVGDLTPPECELLRYLLSRRGQACGRAELLEVMFAAERTAPTARLHSPPVTRLQQYIDRLKQRLGSAGARLQPYGDGYRLI